MTTRYRVEYALKTHRRDQFIEWIKGLLAVPFVLTSDPNGPEDGGNDGSQRIYASRQRYLDILIDVEKLVADHIKLQTEKGPVRSKLKHLVPTVGRFFTPLSLQKAFIYQDERRRISSRRYVPPSFNDVRLMLNTAQIMSLVAEGSVELVTFDGDVTLYEDGQNLTRDNPVLSQIISLLSKGTHVAIVTAAGYDQASRYYDRLSGLLEAIKEATEEGLLSKASLIVLGGESNYMFRFSLSATHLLEYINRDEWLLAEMRLWSEEDIMTLLNIAESALRRCVKQMSLHAHIIRKDRAVGIIPSDEKHKFTREQLEETVLATQQIVESSAVTAQVPFCAFNGGNDVFVDIGDKSWGVLACQSFLGGIKGNKTLHIGDQFLSAGANDFKARLACTTAWIANPDETVALLAELDEHASTVSVASAKP